jgi:hypothetical protein
MKSVSLYLVNLLVWESASRRLSSHHGNRTHRQNSGDCRSAGCICLIRIRVSLTCTSTQRRIVGSLNCTRLERRSSFLSRLFSRARRSALACVAVKTTLVRRFIWDRQRVVDFAFSARPASHGTVNHAADAGEPRGLVD